jgi:hypothetical protein
MTTYYLVTAAFFDCDIPICLFSTNEKAVAFVDKAEKSRAEIKVLQDQLDKTGIEFNDYFVLKESIAKIKAEYVGREDAVDYYTTLDIEPVNFID